MSEIVVVARLEAKAGRDDEARDALVALIAPTHAEDGCQLYALHESQESRGTFFFVERWQSRAHLDAHLANTHLTAFLECVDELFAAPPEISVLSPIAGGDDSRGVVRGVATA